MERDRCSDLEMTTAEFTSDVIHKPDKCCLSAELITNEAKIKVIFSRMKKRKIWKLLTVVVASEEHVDV